MGTFFGATAIGFNAQKIGVFRPGADCGAALQRSAEVPGVPGAAAESGLRGFGRPSGESAVGTQRWFSKHGTRSLLQVSFFLVKSGGGLSNLRPSPGSVLLKESGYLLHSEHYSFI